MDDSSPPAVRDRAFVIDMYSYIYGTNYLLAHMAREAKYMQY